MALRSRRCDVLSRRKQPMRHTKMWSCEFRVSDLLNQEPWGADASLDGAGCWFQQFWLCRAWISKLLALELGRTKATYCLETEPWVSSFRRFPAPSKECRSLFPEALNMINTGPLQVVGIAVVPVWFSLSWASSRPGRLGRHLSVNLAIPYLKFQHLFEDVALSAYFQIDRESPALKMFLSERALTNGKRTVEVYIDPFKINFGQWI